MKITLAPTKTIIQEKCLWKHVTCLTVWILLSFSPPLSSLFPAAGFYETLLYCSFALLSLSFHIWPCVFLFPPLLFLFGRFNAFTPPLHSCACFIHQSQHYLTNPTASSFAPLHLPLHHPPSNTWSVPGGLYTPRYSAPLLPLTESLEVSLVLICWWSSLRPYSNSREFTHIYTHTHIHTMDLVEVINSLEMLGISFFLEQKWSLLESIKVPVSINKIVMMLIDMTQFDH